MDDVPDRIEHTVLGPTTTWTDVTDVLDTALREGMSACIPPCYVAEASEYAPGVRIATVVGFPHGQHATAIKSAEAQKAWEDGADEVDMVANLGALTAGDDDAVRDDIAEVVAAVPIPVKVIVEAPLLAESELRRVSAAAADAGAAFLKTATGFSEGGATVSDVSVMSEYLPVKASGGVGSWEEAQAMFAAGAERIGASSGDVIVAEYRAASAAESDDEGQPEAED